MFKESAFERWLAEFLRWALLAAIFVGLAYAVLADYLPPLPPFKYWPSVEAGWVISALLLGVVLSFIGAERCKIPWWMAWTIIILATATAGFGLWALALKQYHAANFCYFAVNLNKPMSGGGYEWQLRNSQQRFISPVEICRFDGEHKTQPTRCYFKKGSQSCRKESVNMTTSTEKEMPIKAGNYYFMFGADNSWEQSLEVWETPQGPGQLGIIYRGEEEEWRFSNGARKIPKP